MSQLKIKLLKNLYPYKKGEVIEMSEEKYATKKFLQKNSGKRKTNFWC